ncbi:unnamed protein product [Owenia fusiformis]|uniref:Homeobox domain-containing protein n=1 Tax=Owenia fusiformis TaxID=6347 RepID=A0A8S4P1Z9_OWEFU|nr:unnamed protein product [Owenia fusiformis]
MLFNMVSPSPVYPAPLNLSTNTNTQQNMSLAHQHALTSSHAHALLMENILRERRVQFERTMAAQQMAYEKRMSELSPHGDRDLKEFQERPESPPKPKLKFGVSAILSSAISPKSSNDKKSVSPSPSVSPPASSPVQRIDTQRSADQTSGMISHGYLPGMLPTGCCGPRPVYGNILQPLARHPYFGNPAMLPLPNAFSLLSSMRGKPRRGMLRRAVFSDAQRKGLEEAFQKQKYISKPDRKKLGEKLGLKDSQVKIWFQNRRMKWRNSKERELLSSGGSRDSTLPTRDNPNPDLSDVGIGSDNSDNACDIIKVPSHAIHRIDNEVAEISQSDIAMVDDIDEGHSDVDSSDDEYLDVS